MTTLATQMAALAAAEQLGRAHGYLPFARIEFSPYQPDVIQISLHENLGDFDQWRSALGIPHSAVDYKPNGPSRMYLQAAGEFAGVKVEITGFGTAVEAPACAPSS
ncbi:hypothetical protein [Streptomyces sp. Isolate_219]|uniref:hypothetical protein n=1 Tax=Streptomyces sp. Isolate_219 TaxID=2950110 RepID=UPI0021C65CD4|nr:hypothetical protein [Streptomyces sp. Isolate_219]MCR8574701.1 hypothetical protein [Streptomyces sp. Isolate_219]